MAFIIQPQYFRSNGSAARYNFPLGSDEQSVSNSVDEVACCTSYNASANDYRREENRRTNALVDRLLGVNGESCRHRDHAEHRAAHYIRPCSGALRWRRKPERVRRNLRSRCGHWLELLGFYSASPERE